VDDYLLDTSILSVLLDPHRKFHAAVKAAIAAFPAEASQSISSIALAELIFGAKLLEASGAMPFERLLKIIADARTYRVMEITRHTCDEYAELKVNIARTYLNDILKDRRRYIEDWIDKVTCKILQIGENDLWMCAQARERNLVLVTADGRMERISKADAKVKILVIQRES
jgi:predicted nucleic acid-binding protein